jgi:WD40 repeat protein
MQARLEWRLNNLPASLSLLRQIEPARRGWEWHYLQGLHQGELLTLSRPDLPVLGGLAFSPDGRHVAVAGGNPYQLRQDGTHLGRVVIFDALSGEVMRELGGFAHQANGVAYSPDGRLLATSSDDGRLRVWQAETGRKVAEINTGANLLEVVWSPDGAHVLSGGVGAALVWQWKTGRTTRLEGGVNVGSVAWHPSGKLIAAAGSVVRLFEWPSGKLLRSLDHGADAVAFSPDGKSFAASIDSVVRLYDGTGERQRHGLAGHEGRVGGIAFSPDGSQLASAGADTTVRIWDAVRGKLVAIWRGHLGRANAVAFHPDGWVVASSGSQPGDVRLWDLTRQQEAACIPDRHGRTWVEAMAFDRDARLIRVARPGLGTVETYDALTLESRQVRPLGTARNLIAPGCRTDFSADGSRAAVVEVDRRTVRVWRTDGWTALPCVQRVASEWALLSLSGDGRRLAVTVPTGAGGPSSELIVRDVDGGGVLLEAEQAGQLPSAAKLNADGSLLARAVARFAEATDDQGRQGWALSETCVEVWDVPAPGRPAPKQPRLRLNVPGKAVAYGLAFDASSGRLAASTFEGKVLVWELPSGKPLPGGPLEGPQTLQGLAFSPDGRLLAGASRTHVVLWDVREGLEVARLRGGPPRTQDLAFNPRVVWSADGKKLAASNWEGSVSIWDVGREQGERRAAVVRSARWHLERATDAHGRGDFDAVAFHLDRLDRAAVSSLCWERCDLRARMGRRREVACEVLGRMSFNETHAHLSYRRYALLCVQERDFNRYAACREAAWKEHVEHAEGPGAKADVLAVCAVGPLGPYQERAVRVAREVRAGPRKYSWELHACALVFYRAGLYDDAIATAHEANRAEGQWHIARPINALVLALAHRRRGDTAEADKWLAEARAWHDKEARTVAPGRVPAAASWQDWLHAEMLLAEAEKQAGEPRTK